MAARVVVAQQLRRSWGPTALRAGTAAAAAAAARAPPPLPARRWQVATRSSSSSTDEASTAATAASEEQPAATAATPEAAANGAATAAEPSPTSELPAKELEFVEPSGGQKTMTSLKLAFALPWRRFKKGSALVLKLSGQISEQPQGRFSSTTSLPALCECLKKAALDPRVAGVVIRIDPLACGWAKLQELRRHVEFFRQSGKWSIAYMERAGEKEYYLASAFEEIYAPPSASLSLRGMSVSGTFLRGVLEKVGVEPEVRRIGKYKSAGDQLLRADMSEAQREQLSALLDDIYAGFVADVAASRGKAPKEVEEFLDAGVFEMEKFKQQGYVTDLLYECELEEILKSRTGGKEDEVAKVGYKKYKSVSPSAFGPSGKKAVAIIRTAGAITGGEGGTGTSITSGDVIRQLRGIKKNKNVAAVVLRVDSPGGDALASDLMWREIQELGKTKPVVASISDVGASGGYYMSMAASKIVAEPLTITGSIGVVTGKFNLVELYNKIGYNKETLSKGKYAQLLVENKPFTEEEARLFDAGAQHAYESFRNKAASSRGMSVEAMEEVAQGRVWSGQRAATIGLVDAVGGVSRAIQLAKQAAGLAADEAVRVVEVSRAKTSPLQLLAGGGGAMASLPAGLGMLLLTSLVRGGSAAQGAAATSAAVGAPVLLEALAAALATTAADSSTSRAAVVGSSNLGSNLVAGQVRAEMPDIAVEGVASQALLQQATFTSCLFDDE